MRIAYVTESYPPEPNGVATTACRTVAALRECGHEVRVVRPRQPGLDDRPQAVAPSADQLTRGLPMPGQRPSRVGLATPGQLQHAWREFKPNLVHLATPGPLGLAAAIAGRRNGAAVTADLRAGLGPARAGGYLRWLHGHAHRSFVATPELRDEFARQGYGRLAVVGRGVDADFYTPELRRPELRAAWGAGEPRQVVMLYVGRLTPAKQPELALQAFRAVARVRPGTRMVVIGDGPSRRQLEAAYPDANFLGVRTGVELAACYASADVFLYPSLDDSFGSVVLEALASGLVVVAHDSAASARAHLHHGVDALLCPAAEGAHGYAQRATRAALLSIEPSPMRYAARATALSLPWAPALRRFIDQVDEVAFEVHLGSLRHAAVA